ncbi:MAG: hypothetical protein J7647_14020 [Cyanobacteria bacterium SBLK]|nr:hypothetical protein [Cyanobacteria bacterium SBLK]
MTKTKGHPRRGKRKFTVDIIEMEWLSKTWKERVKAFYDAGVYPIPVVILLGARRIEAALMFLLLEDKYFFSQIAIDGENGVGIGKARMTAIEEYARQWVEGRSFKFRGIQGKEEQGAILGKNGDKSRETVDFCQLSPASSFCGDF